MTRIYTDFYFKAPQSPAPPELYTIHIQYFYKHIAPPGLPLMSPGGTEYKKILTCTLMSSGGAAYIQPAPQSFLTLWKRGHVRDMHSKGRRPFNTSASQETLRSEILNLPHPFSYPTQ